MASVSNISMAISNPCFELWPLLHFKQCRRYVSAADLRTMLRSAMKDYDKHLDCQKLDGLRRTAIRNAIALDELHGKNGAKPGSNPSTGVWRLVENLEECAGPPALR